MIPIAKPYLGQEEVAAASAAIQSGWVSQGPKVQAFEQAFSDYVGADYACAVSNCTAALHLALLAVGVSPGDIVITVSHSFIATANAVRYCGAEPVFVDIDFKTFNMCPDILQQFIDTQCEMKADQLFVKDVTRLILKNSPLSFLKRTQLGRIAAIMPAHQIGMPCDIKRIVDIANQYQLPVIEDAACAIGSEIEIGAGFEKIGKPHGDIACFSFHPRKIITTGEGGMITTNSKDYDAQFRLLRQHGMSVPDTVRHGSKKLIVENYVKTGFNYRMTDIQAAIGIEQLKKMPEIMRQRQQIDQWYRHALSDIDWLTLPVLSSDKKTNWQSYAVRVLAHAPMSRDALIQHLLDNGIAAKPGIMNSHQELPYQFEDQSLLSSEAINKGVILLPFFCSLEASDVQKIEQCLRKAGA